MPDGFEVGEEECPVLMIGPPTARETDSFEWRPRSGGVLEEIPRIQCAVAKEFVGAPMKSIGARPGDCVDHSSGGLAVLCRVIAGQNREFLNSVQPKFPPRTLPGARGIVVKTDAVQAIVILLWSCARDGQLLPEAPIATIRATAKVGCVWIVSTPAARLPGPSNSGR